MKEVIINKLSYPLKLIDLLWDIRVNPKKAFSLIDVESDKSLSKCIIDVIAIFAFYWLIVEISLYYFDLNLFSMPGFYYQTYLELNLIISSIPLLIIFWITYGKEKKLRKKEIFICILYIYMSNIYWNLWLKGLLWVLSLIGFKLIDEYILYGGKFFIFFHGVFLLIYLAKEKELIERNAKNKWFQIGFSTLLLSIPFTYASFKLLRYLI